MQLFQELSELGSLRSKVSVRNLFDENILDALAVLGSSLEDRLDCLSVGDLVEEEE